LRWIKVKIILNYRSLKCGMCPYKRIAKGVDEKDEETGKYDI
jgi:hypothetical protein